MKTSHLDRLNEKEDGSGWLQELYEGLSLSELEAHAKEQGCTVRPGSAAADMIELLAAADKAWDEEHGVERVYRTPCVRCAGRIAAGFTDDEFMAASLQLSQATSSAIADPDRLFGSRKQQLATAEELDQLRAAQAEFERLWAQFEEHTVPSVKKRLLAALEQAIADPNPERIAEFKGTAGINRGLLDEQFRGVRRVLRGAMERLFVSSTELVSAIRRRAWEMAGECVEEQLVREYLVARSYGVPFHPSQTLLALRNAQAQATGITENYMTSPAKRVAGLATL